MPQIFDARGNEYQGALDAINGLTLTDARTAVNVLNAAGSVSMDIVGKATLAIHVNVTVAFNAGTSLVVEGTLDGSNFFTLPFFVVQASAASLTAEAMAVSVPGGTLVGQYLLCVSATGFRQVRVRMAFTAAGTASIAMRATAADYRIYAQPTPSLLHVTAVGTSGVAVTATLPAVAGMFHYIGSIQLQRICSVAVAAAAAPLIATTTNLNGSPAWQVPNSVDALGNVVNIIDYQYTQPLKSSAANTNTTFVGPTPQAGNFHRWNITYYVGA